LPTLSINLPRMQLALMYLVSNAIEALDGLEQKKLAVSARRDGENLLVSLKDSAPPITVADQARMFDAFYTTKTGDHLGLGLTVARATVEDHGGTLLYYPEKGFSVTLPLRTKYA